MKYIFYSASVLIYAFLAIGIARSDMHESFKWFLEAFDIGFLAWMVGQIEYLSAE